MTNRIEDEPQAALLLSSGDKTSPTWLKLAAHLNEELRVARIKNDNEKLTEQQTAALRGRIATLKSILRLGDISPVITTDG